MTTRSAWIDQIENALRGGRRSVERIGETLNIKDGPGRLANKVNADLGVILDHLEQADPDQRRQDIAGFASGVRAVLREPGRSKAADWTWEQAAGRLMPNLEVPTFLTGVEACGAQPAWHAPFGPDLVLVLIMELDRGLRVLPRAQVEQWGATDDRVYSAARSMLFHRTRPATLHEDDPVDGVWRVKIGDGYDAARALVLPEVFFMELDEQSFYFGAPHQEALYFTQSDEDAVLERLRGVLAEQVAHAEYPLSARVHRLEAGRPANASTVA